MGGPTRPRVGRLDALDLVLHLLVQVLQKLQVLVRGVPVATAVGLQEGGQHVAEGVGVGVQQPLAHLLVLDEGLVGVLVNEVVHLAGRGAPAHGVAQPLGDLARALVAAVQHALVELGVEQLGAGVQAHRLAERAHLRVGSCRVRDERAGLLAVLAQALHHLGGVAVVVVGHVCKGDLRGVQVLEGHVHLGQGALEQVRLLLHHARLVGVEGEALALGELLLQLLLILPAAVLNGQAHVGRVGAGRVGEHAAGGVAQRDVQLLGLLQRVLAHKVHLQGLVRLGGQLDAPVQQVHLVDEQVPEDARAGHHHVNARPAQLLQRDQLHLVHAAQRVGNGAHTRQRQHLRQRLAICLDVVRAPEGEGHRLGVGPAVLLGHALQQPVAHLLRHVHGRLRGDALGVQRVHVLARGQHVRVADGVPAGARHHVVAVQRGDQAAELVVGHHLLQAELQVAEERGQVVIVHLGEARFLQGLLVGGPAEHVVEELHGPIEERHHLLHAALSVGAALDGGTHGLAGGLSDLLQQGHVLQLTRVRALVHVADVAANALGQDAGQGLDAVLGAVDARNVHQGGH
mmetsp:Transcript_35577/g.55911  ORF Transcript_35577/g.55911 Transcript_35577/m.55911 type:complete len:571 (-) Transcript_35577:844-2556(-)